MKAARMVFCTALVVWLAAVFAWAGLQVRLTPRSLNVNSKGQYFKCHLWDPEGIIDVEQIAVPVTMMICNYGIVESIDVDSVTVEEEGRHPVDGDVLTVYFLREDIQAAVDGYPDRSEVEFYISGVVGGSGGGGTPPVVYYDSETTHPGGVPLPGSVSYVLPSGDYNGVQWFNVSQLSGGVIILLFGAVGGQQTFLYLQGDDLGPSYALPEIDWNTPVTVWILDTQTGSAYTIGFSLTNTPTVYGEPTGGEPFQADDVIRVLRKDRGKKK